MSYFSLSPIQVLWVTSNSRFLLKEHLKRVRPADTLTRLETHALVVHVGSFSSLTRGEWTPRSVTYPVFACYSYTHSFAYEKAHLRWIAQFTLGGILRPFFSQALIPALRHMSML